MSNEGLPEGGLLALDLMNTETMDRGKKRDLLSSPDGLARWWEEASRHHPDECHAAEVAETAAFTGGLLDAVLALRRTLRTLLTHVVQQQMIEERDLKPINEILALCYCALERTDQGHVREVRHLRDPKKGSILVPIALSAAQLFTENDWHRLHQCRSDRCIVFFYDTTKSATRRWCSPNCMNRARSKLHYQISRNESPRQ